MAADSRVSQQEKYFYYNSLTILLKAVEGERTTVDLRNESFVNGVVEHVDGYMNIVMKNCVFTDPRGDSFKYDMFFVHARNIRYVHIPPKVATSRRSLSKIIKKWTEIVVNQPRNCSRRVLRWDTPLSYANKYRCYSTKMTDFKFSDYDCIGFDLDNTLLRYNVTNMVTLEYNILAKFLVEERGYDSKYLYRTLDQTDFDFMQKGLVLDLERGNILKLNSEGKIIRVTHGTKQLSRDEIEKIYSNGRWTVINKFIDDMLVTWNGPLSEKMRTLLDYFDMPSSLIFARTVDTLDDNNGGKPLTNYCIWPDVLAGLINMFERQNFSKNTGHYFPALKQNPGKFIHRSSSRLISWLAELKKTKVTYLITGSNSDFADFTASYALGDNWKELFDTVICYARKPNFFVGSRPFLKIKDHVEEEAISSEVLERGQMYSQGNWKDLRRFFSRITNKTAPNCLYVGDNLIQDIYAPKLHANCDTIAIVEEQLAEGMLDHSLSHDDERIINSKHWGSYFLTCNGNESSKSLWTHVINNYSKICVPSMEFVAQNPLDTPLQSFDDRNKNLNGYYPGKPISIAAKSTL